MMANRGIVPSTSMSECDGNMELLEADTGVNL